MVHKFYHQCVVVDNSVLIKGFIVEEYSQIVYELLDMNLKREVTLLAPTILIYEFFNIISRAYQSFDGIGYAYEKLKNLNLSLIDPSDEILMYASDYLFKNKKISYYDAVYHSLAKEMNATFLTADKKYYDQMKKEGNVEWLGNLAKNSKKK
ncbi:MAG: type II toxin-antitoxin system VapC family toxin [Candidatus Gracilibacteria bacterium]|nr:type II toxin-antitoxin system VapC family toxin [Candidatus Gracilibacteria bacterium]